MVRLSQRAGSISASVEQKRQVAFYLIAALSEAVIEKR